MVFIDRLSTLSGPPEEMEVSMRDNSDELFGLYGRLMRWAAPRLGTLALLHVEVFQRGPSQIMISVGLAAGLYAAGTILAEAQPVIIPETVDIPILKTALPDAIDCSTDSGRLAVEPHVASLPLAP